MTNNSQHASYCASQMEPKAECDCQPQAQSLKDLLCPPHANLDAAGQLEPFDNCIACIRVERDELRDALADRETQALAREAAALDELQEMIGGTYEPFRLDDRNERVYLTVREVVERFLEKIKQLRHPSQASALERREGQVREDERAACWEDFIRVIENAMSDAGESFDLTALREAIWLQGWALLGTGDGKPMHKRDDSMVKEWTKENRSAPASPEPKEKLDEA